MNTASMISRAQGCLLGQLAGDALGSLVEFQAPEKIHQLYPNGVRNMADGGTWDTIAGQPTDDSEMALVLARALLNAKSFDDYPTNQVRRAYEYWLHSGPFDCGVTIRSALTGRLNPASEANGALMRISPLGIFCAGSGRHGQVAQWAMRDAELTHPHPICLQANALFARAICWAIQNQTSPEQLYNHIRQWADGLACLEPALKAVIITAETAPPSDYLTHSGWVLVAFHNALWQLLHADNLEEGIIDTIMRGGDTDTNAAICGALLGAVYGREAIPPRWVRVLENCRPSADKPNVRHPRPECFWPIDALALAEALLNESLKK
ncbi:ADP-ribosylglycohydrolase family protein [Deltaproteobacteria bacterium OttesenSCG-928-M10]|nr:ADP-ribosylglycohydrolase family protein [Deltaproteobacteria bacterium OttesenSCG-928-M10]